MFGLTCSIKETIQLLRFFIEERCDEDNTNKNTKSGNEECPRLEQLQMMSLEELQTELTKIQAQSKANVQILYLTFCRRQ
jgi:hypothetical protein